MNQEERRLLLCRPVVPQERAESAPVGTLPTASIATCPFRGMRLSCTKTSTRTLLLI